MSIKKVALIAFAALVGGCASNTNIVDAGQGQHFIEKQQATGFPGLGNLRADVYSEVSKFCATKGRDFSTTSYMETKPPYILGNYPRVSLTFACE